MDDNTLEKIKDEIYLANNALDNIQEMLEIPDEVKEFLLDLSVNKDLPQEIQDEAHRLWHTIY